MPDITISPPSIGMEAYFTFKEPVIKHIRDKLNTDDSAIMLKVIGVNNLRSLLEAELRDPYVDTYAPLGISDQDYRKDVLDDVPLYVFSYRDMAGKTVYIKSPLNYIAGFSLTLDIVYTNRLVVMDLQKLPNTLDPVVVFSDLSDMVYDRLGVRPTFKEVSIGEPELVTREEHLVRETMRTEGISVHKSTAAALAEITLKYNQLTARLTAMNIILG